MKHSKSIRLRLNSYLRMRVGQLNSLGSPMTFDNSASRHCPLVSRSQKESYKGSWITSPRLRWSRNSAWRSCAVSLFQDIAISLNCHYSRGILWRHLMFKLGKQSGGFGACLMRWWTWYPVIFNFGAGDNPRYANCRSPLLQQSETRLVILQ